MQLLIRLGRCNCLLEVLAVPVRGIGLVPFFVSPSCSFYSPQDCAVDPWSFLSILC